MSFLSRFFKRKLLKPSSSLSEEELFEQHYDAKQKGLEKVLGKMHTVVGHALIPFGVGGSVDMYYFLKGIPGTGFATMELIEPDATGPQPNQHGTYELVAFTKLIYDYEEEHSPFVKIERHLCGILTRVANYAYQAVLESGDTCELPNEEEPNTCLIFFDYRPEEQSFEIAGKPHGLLLVMEFFREEMEYAMEHGSQKLLQLLQEKGAYPYSDLDRESVV